MKDDFLERLKYEKKTLSSIHRKLIENHFSKKNLNSDPIYANKNETFSFEMKDEKRITPEAISSSKMTGLGFNTSTSIHVNATPTKVTCNSQDLTPLSATEIKQEKQDCFDYKNLQNIRINM